MTPDGTQATLPIWDAVARSGTAAPSPSDAASPVMVAVVREAQGWTQRDLQSRTGLSQGYISKVENGLLQLSGTNLTTVAAALGCPPSLLTADERSQAIHVTCLHHRRYASKMSVGTIRLVEATTHLTRITVEGIAPEPAREPDQRLVRATTDHHGNAAGVAQYARQMWDIPDGPIADMTGLVESLGVIVVERHLPLGTQDAVSSWPDLPGHPPILLVNTGLPTDRARFTLAHELGHLVMHQVPGEAQEAEANGFAGELLAPEGQIRADLAGLTTGDFPRLMALKAKWGMSLGALIQRARDLDLITDRQHREFRVRLSKMGWHRVEPGDLPPERPQLLRRAIAERLSEPGMSIEKLAADALMTPSAFRRHYMPGLDPRTAER